MDHKLGRIDLVTWQGRRNRRIQPGASAWLVLVVLCAVIGALGTGAQALGWLTLTGPVSAVPPVLILLAISAQLVAVMRALLTWLAG